MSVRCRICLSRNSKENNILDGSEILHKFSLCFVHEILLDNSLPQTICKFCEEKLKDVLEFCHQIIQNQNILLSMLKNDSMTINCLGKNLDKDSELENKENEVHDIIKHVKSEQTSVLPDDESLSKNEPETMEAVDSSSDEDVSLSYIKQTKDYKVKLKQKSHSSKSVSVKQDNITSLGINITCLTCFKINSTQMELLKHYNKEHKNDKIKTGEDDKPEKKDLNFELVTQSNGLVKFKCKNCEKLFDSKRKMNRHIISHIEDRPFLCKLCGRTYKTASEIVRHGRAHNGAKIPCSYQCGYSTVYLGALKQHERRHRTEYTYTCEKCGKGFQVLTWYEQHQNVHTGVKPFVCEICGVAFHMDRYLKAHMTTVHPHASTRKRFLCVHCSKPCDSKKELTLHLKEHGITSKFLCDMCGKVLSDCGQLKLHKRMHLGERPYSCRFHKGVATDTARQENGT